MGFSSHANVSLYQSSDRDLFTFPAVMKESTMPKAARVGGIFRVCGLLFVSLELFIIKSKI